MIVEKEKNNEDFWMLVDLRLRMLNYKVNSAFYTLRKI